MTEDRPLECSECKKSVKVCYSEIVGNVINRYGMCEECPALQRHLHGELASQNNTTKETESKAGICCGTCDTSLESIRMGTPLGCPDCYNVFSDILIYEILATSPTTGKHIHIGRSPDENIEINPSARLLALNEALNETLAREDYEQAAWLRDQINAIMGKTDA